MSELRAGHLELTELLAAVVEGRVDEAARGRLNELMANDPAARAVYIDYVAMDTMLRWLRNADAQAAGAPEVASVIGLGRGAEPTREARPAAGVLRWAAPAALAAAVLVAGALIAIVSGAWSRAQEAAAPLPAPVAVLSDAGDVVVVEGLDEAAPVGGQLRPGWVQLASGVAEITFNDGATVRLEGPARLRLAGANRAELDHGRLAAHVPPSATGFTVGVGGWDVVDMGTSFGIAAGGGGAADVHVFEGEVRVSPTDGSGTGRRLTARQAVRVDGRAMVQARYDRGPFGGLLMDLSDAESVEPPVTAGLALWLSADRGVERDDDGAVGVWRSRLGLADRRAQQTMLERRPTWIASGLADRPVMRFDGDDFMQLPTTSALGLVESDYEMFFVAATQDSGVQFLVAASYGAGMEQFEVHLNGQSGLRFIPRHHFERPDGTPIDASYADHGAEGAHVGRVHLIEARVEGGVGAAAVDGVQSTDTVADARSLYRGELSLGMRGNATMGLRGDMAEVLVYNRALSEAERIAVRGYLVSKYEMATTAERDGGSSLEQGNAHNEEGVRP